MKKISYSIFVFALGINLVHAKPITPVSAKTVAENFYRLNSAVTFNKSTLVHTALSVKGLPLYYAYNINENDGFVIVSADDVVKPIVGYSTENGFVVPQAHSNISYWLNEFSSGVEALRTQGAVANEKIANEWAKYSSEKTNLKQINNGQNVTSGNAIAPIVKTHWNQSPYYNALCPGGSVTGCVATTMAQIMKYWEYPATGTGSSSYTQSNNPNNYPMQSANYGATTYNWANMPLIVSSSNNDVAVLNYQCGVSVNMDYDPTGSGAQVLGGNPSAQYSYKTYFKYDPTQLHGLNRNSINNDTRWIDTIEHDLNIGRPVQYVGVDPNEGGHTWVCDGYDANNNLHMNWGWGGSNDGYFALNNFQTTNGTFNPSSYHQVLVGIVPKATNAIDASVYTVSSPLGIYCSNSFTPVITLRNFGSTSLTSCIINYQIDNGVVQTLNWSGTLVNQQFTSINLPAFTSTAGTHTLTCFTSNPNNTVDQNSANDQSSTIFTVNNSHASLPIVEGFESGSSIWNMSHTSTGVDWMVTSATGATGSNSIMLDNMSNTSGNNSILQTNASYDLTAFTSPALTFKAAYQEKATSNNDKLQVYTSTDCGASWVSRKAILSTALSALSGGVSSTPYVPTPNQFTTYTVGINAVANSNNVMFRWEFYAGTSLGNNLYLDDINIVDASVTGVKNIGLALDLNVYPNPATDKVNIDFSLTEKHNISVTLVDILGRSVESISSKTYEAGQNKLVIAASKSYEAGVYFVNMDVDGQRISKKIVIQ